MPVAPETAVIAEFARESLDLIVLRPAERQYLPQPPSIIHFSSSTMLLWFL
jgi:hypothetical protein